MNKTIARALLRMMHLPNCPLDEGNLEQVSAEYEAVLGDLPDDLLDAAATHYLAVGTFFPTPAGLKKCATDLQVAAAGIPSAGEAWAYVQKSVRYVSPVCCQDGAVLREAVAGAVGEAYWRALRDYETHTGMCGVCNAGGFVDDYRHPIVARVVEMLGGRESLFTDNPAADRSRFVQFYGDVVTREVADAVMVPGVRSAVAQARSQIDGGTAQAALAQLAEGRRV